MQDVPHSAWVYFSLLRSRCVHFSWPCIVSRSVMKQLGLGILSRFKHLQSPFIWMNIKFDRLSTVRFKRKFVLIRFMTQRIFAFYIIVHQFSHSDHTCHLWHCKPVAKATNFIFTISKSLLVFLTLSGYVRVFIYYLIFSNPAKCLHCRIHFPRVACLGYLLSFTLNCAELMDITLPFGIRSTSRNLSSRAAVKACA